jgi:D-3-phosphoglycerate dehydrogenase
LGLLKRRLKDSEGVYTMKVLVTPTSFRPGDPALAELGPPGGTVVFNPHGRPLGEDELIPLLEGCEGYIAGLDFITGRVLDAAAGLKVISRYGAGVDRIDLAATRAKNITVCNTPGVNAQAVADLAMGLLLSVVRKIPLLDKKIREGQWPRSTGTELYGKTMGVLGLGAVGRALAERAKGFSMAVIAHDPCIDRRYAEEHGIAAAGFNEVIEKADFISLHLPLTAGTRRVISRDVMERMKKGAVIINTARGGLVDEDAAAELLKSGHLGGAGIDVYEEEPPKKSPFFGLDNAVLTPHTASHTAEAAAAMAALSVRNLVDVLSGKPCPNVVA